jgi:hypothetical protein
MSYKLKPTNPFPKKQDMQFESGGILWLQTQSHNIQVEFIIAIKDLQR